MFGTGVPVPIKGGERGIQQNLGQGISLTLSFFFLPKLRLEEGAGEGC